jgi:methylamine--corrinoid protein Co-methyltransferase
MKITMTEIMERALTGKICREREFDMTLYKRANELVKEYGISYDPKTPIPKDPGLANSVFKAGFQLFCELGAYCTSTNRIISFSEDEVKEALKYAPAEVWFGEETDRKALAPRKPEDKRPPWCFLGAAGAPVSSEQILSSLVEGYAKIPQINSVTTPALTRVRGVRIRPGTPLEILGTMETVRIAREAMRRAGRPGLPIMNAVATATADSSLIAVLNREYGLRSSDGVLVGILAELKTNFSQLNKVFCTKSFGCRVVGELGPAYGGYAGGAEGTAIVTVAEHLMGLMVYQADCYLSFPIHAIHTASSFREVLWVKSVSAQAISMNTNLLTLYLSYIAAGPATEMALHEIAAVISTDVVSGANIEAVGVAKAKYEDRFTPMEPKFSADVAYAATRLSLQDVNELVKNLLSKYEDKLKNPPLGKKFQEICDIETGKISNEYIELVKKVKRELTDLGLEML